VFVLVERFFLAIQRNDVNSVKLLLEADGRQSLVNEQDSRNGLSPVMTAACAGVL